MTAETVAVVVVTYNRKEFLRECLEALLAQSRPPDEIIVVNNNSMDGTAEMLALEFPQVTVLTMSENIGGAGGFAHGMQLARDKGHNWILIMDDDAILHPEALIRLLEHACGEQKAIMGCLARSRDTEELVWPLKVEGEWKLSVSQVPNRPFVTESLPFLGLLISSRAISEIGLPNSDFFVCCDDVEYSYRASKAGYAIVCIPTSILYHPVPRRRLLRFGKYILCLEFMPPWKGYYDARNRILLGLKFEGSRFWCKHLPVLLLRIALSLVCWGARAKRLRFYMIGILDGFMQRTGKRVIPQ
jgi:GT2 family glycosyltransferase